MGLVFCDRLKEGQWDGGVGRASGGQGDKRRVRKGSRKKTRTRGWLKRRKKMALIPLKKVVSTKVN